MKATQLFVVRLLSSVLAASLILPARRRRQRRPTSARSTRTTPEQAFKTTPLLALRGPQFPDAAVLRRHAPAHVVLDGRRRVRRRLTPRDAYRFARGEEITASSGQPAKLSRPLDFLVVADHSDNMGFFPDLFAGKPEMLADPTGRKWYDMIQSGKGAEAALEIIVSLLAGHVPEGAHVLSRARAAYRGAWQETIDAAEHYNEPGRFTAFIGYEWTSNTGGNNLHRNVIFRDNGDKASQVEPFTTLPAARQRQSRGPLEMDGRLRGEDRRQRARHRAQRQPEQRPDVPDRRGVRASRSTASMPSTRAKWERLYEATQTKGDGEAHPFLSPNDEFADFETLGQGQPRRQRGEDEGDARIRVRPLGAEERPQARSRSSA